MRRPRAAAEWDPESIVPPPVDDERTQSSGGVLPALLALGGAGTGGGGVPTADVPPFGMIGAFVAFGTWGGQRIGSVRRTGHRSRVRQAQAAAFEAASSVNDSNSSLII
jgi:hypothetical protein